MVVEDGKIPTIGSLLEQLERRLTKEHETLLEEIDLTRAELSNLKKRRDREEKEINKMVTQRKTSSNKQNVIGKAYVECLQVIRDAVVEIVGESAYSTQAGTELMNAFFSPAETQTSDEAAKDNILGLRVAWAIQESRRLEKLLVVDAASGGV